MEEKKMEKKIIAVNAGPRMGWNTETLISEASTRPTDETVPVVSEGVSEDEGTSVVSVVSPSLVAELGSTSESQAAKADSSSINISNKVKKRFIEYLLSYASERPICFGTPFGVVFMTLFHFYYNTPHASCQE